MGSAANNLWNAEARMRSGGPTLSGDAENHLSFPALVGSGQSLLPGHNELGDFGNEQNVRRLMKLYESLSTVCLVISSVWSCIER